MHVRSFYDNYRRKLEKFMELVESGDYKPIHQTPLDQLTEEEWFALFQNWQSLESLHKIIK